MFLCGTVGAECCAVFSNHPFSAAASTATDDRSGPRGMLVHVDLFVRLNTDRTTMTQDVRGGRAAPRHPNIHSTLHE